MNLNRKYELEQVRPSISDQADHFLCVTAHKAEILCRGDYAHRIVNDPVLF